MRALGLIPGRGSARSGIPLLLPLIASTAQSAVASARPELGQSVALVVLGDSTGVTPDIPTGVVAKLSEQIAARWPGVAVVRADWSDAQQEYSCSQAIGTAVPRHFVATAALTRTIDVGSVGAFTDLDLRVTCALDSYTPAAGTRSFCGQYGASGTFGHRLQLRTDGRLNYNWSPDGTTAMTATSTAALATTMGIADGDRIQVRIVHDVDNGAGGNTVQFFARKPGDLVWTQIGTDITAAGITSIYRHATRVFEIGGTSTVGLPGKYFAWDYRASIKGASVLPAGLTIELVRGGENTTGTGGAPTIYIYNGSKPGADLAYLTGDATRFPLMLPQLLVPTQVVLNDGHNETGAESSWTTALDTALGKIRARLISCDVAVTTQNPRFDQPATPPRSRMAQILGWAAKNGIGVLDTYAACVRDGRPLDALFPGGLHPSSPGGVELLLRGYAALLGR